MGFRMGLWGLALGILWGCGEDKTEGPIAKTPAKTEPVAVEPEFPNEQFAKTTVASRVSKTSSDEKPAPLNEENVTEKQAATKLAGRQPDPETPIDLESQKILDGEAPDGTPQVIALLKHKNPLVREAAIGWFGYDPLPPEAIKPVAERLYDPNADVAEAAADKLKDVEDVSSIRAELIAALAHEDWSVQGDVARMCQKLPSAQRPDLESLVPLLGGEYTDPSGPVLELIGMMGPEGKAAAPHVVPLLELSGGFSGREERYLSLSEAAAETLGKIDATEELFRLARSDSSGEEKLAVQGLVHVRPMTPQIQALILRLAQDEDNYYRDEMIEALGFMSPLPPEIAKVIDEALSDEEEDVRIAAVRALGRANPKPASAFSSILKAMKDEDEDVRRAASDSLGRFSDQPELRIKALLAAVNDDGLLVADNALDALKESFDESFPLMLKALRDGKELEEIRMGSARALASYKIQIPDDKKSAVAEVMTGILDNSQENIDLRTQAAIVLYGLEEEHDGQAEALVAGLKSSQRVSVRESAALHLSHFPSEETVAALTAALEDREGSVCYYSASSLGNLGDVAQAAIPALIRITSQKEHKARTSAAQTLGKISSKETHAKTVPVLMALAKDEDVDARESALDALRTILNDVKYGEEKLDANDALVKLFIEGLKDENLRVRSSAAEALQPLGPLAAAAVPALIVGLGDESEYVRRGSVDALKEIGEAARPAEDALIRAATDNKEEYIRRSAIETLGVIQGDPKKIVPVLCELLKNEDLQYSALEALKGYGEHAETALPDLQALLDSPEDYKRSTALTVLGQLGPKAKSVIPRLKEILQNDGDDSARNEAAKALLKIAPESDAANDILEATLRGNVESEWLEEFREQQKETLLTLLTSAQNHKDAEVRAGALRELKQLRDVPGQEAALVKALKDSEAKVRLQAALALYEIGGHKKTIAPILVESLDRIDDENRWELQRIFHGIGARIIPALVKRAADKNEPLAVRKFALEYLSEMGSMPRHVAPELKKIALDEGDPLRYLAAFAWQNASRNQTEIQAELTPILLSALKSPEVESEIRQQAASNLGHFNTENAEVIPALFAVLIDKEADENLRRTAGYALGSKPLDEARTKQVLAMLSDTETQDLAVEILGRQESLPMDAVAPLLDLLKGSGDPHYMLSTTISRTGEPGLKALLSLATDSSASLSARKRALKALGQFSEAPLKNQAIAGVTPLLQAQPIRQNAAFTLAWLEVRSDEVLDSVLESLLDADQDQRNTALESLESLSREEGPGGQAVDKIIPLLSQAKDAKAKENLLSALIFVGRGSRKAAQVVVDQLRQNPDSDFRERFRYTVSTLGPPVDEVLAETLASKPSREVTLLCLEAIAQSWNRLPKAVPAIREYVNHDDPEIAFEASIALAKQAADDAAALPVLLNALNSEEEDQHEKLGRALGGIQAMGREAAPAVPRIMELFDDERFGEQAMLALGAIGEPAKEALPQILAALKRPRTRDSAARVLGQWGAWAEPAVSELVKAVEQEETSYATIQALLQIGPAARAVVPVLAAQLQDEFLRLDALGYLGNFGPLAQEAIPKVLPYVTDSDPPTRAAALLALAQIGNVPAEGLASIRERITDEDAYVRHQAAYALGRLKAEPEESVAVLQAALKDTEERVRREAIDALGEFGPQADAAVPDLLPFLSDQDESLKYASIEALGQIGPPAKSAVPQLLALAQSDSESYLKQSAGVAVWQIEPDSARAANLPEPPPAHAEKPRESVD